jgi:hypothetical protein
MDVHGGLNLFPASFGFASGGYIADTKVSGQVASASQQQGYSRDSNFGSWNRMLPAGTVLVRPGQECSAGPWRDM